jgi:hypothetical protein
MKGMTSWRNIILDPVELAEIYEWFGELFSNFLNID